MNKQCTKCQVTKNHKDFPRLAASRDGLSYWCKACHKIYNAGWQKAHPGHNKKYGAKWRKTHSKAITRGDFKKRYYSHDCQGCGKPMQLWHHVDPTTKLYNVGRMQGMLDTTIEDEIAKCIPLCYSCHTILHLGEIRNA